MSFDILKSFSNNCNKFKFIYYFGKKDYINIYCSMCSQIFALKVVNDYTTSMQTFLAMKTNNTIIDQ